MSIHPEFKPEDHKTWSLLYQQQTPLRFQQLIPEFSQGLALLGINGSEIPNLDRVNLQLNKLTGWSGVYVQGFVEADKFFEMLKNKQFPVGAFIRNPKDLSYTPEPDVFHDLYGHLPFYTIPEYAKFCQEFGTRALKYAENQSIIDQFQRLFWFAVEFGLVKTSSGVRVFGAGIASSFTESAYALSNKPRVHRFDLDVIRKKDFRIDIIQEDLYLLENQAQLYKCLDSFEGFFQ